MSLDLERVKAQLEAKRAELRKSSQILIAPSAEHPKELAAGKSDEAAPNK